MEILILIAILIYILSALVVYKYTQKAYYNPEGRFYGDQPDRDDIVMTIIPVFNTIAAFTVVFNGWRNPNTKKSTSEKFFKPKK